MGIISDKIMSRQIKLERLQVHATMHRLPVLGLMVHNTLELVEYYDRGMELCIQVLASVCKGDTTTKEKVTTKQVEFEVFETWWDHLKYDLKEGRILLLPLWLKRRLRIKYLKIRRNVQVAYPVEMLHVCPHAGFDWDGKPHHIQHLYPELDLKDYR